MTQGRGSSVGRFFTCALSAATRRRSAQPQLAPTAARKAGARRRKASAQEPQTTHRSGTSSAGGSQRGGPVSDYKGLHARGSTCRGWLRRRMVLDRTRAWGKKGNPHRGSAFAAGPRPRAGSPGEGRNPSRVPGSSGRWPLAQERRAARAHARPQWRPPSARGGGISTWLAAPSHRGRQETASAALLQVPREPPERVEHEQRWLRWRGVAREARARDGGAR